MSLELGAKGSLLDDRLRLEATVFNVQVDDMQFFEFLVGPFGLLRLNGNVDEVSLQGAEVAPPGRLRTFSMCTPAGATWTARSKPTACGRHVGNKSPYTPDWTASAGAPHRHATDRRLAAGGLGGCVRGGRNLFTWFRISSAPRCSRARPATSRPPGATATRC